MDELKYPIGIQSFGDIRNRGCVYVDKTADMHRLINYNKYIFLGRPRRFGKSLLMSTVEAYFLGQRHLFEGLAITHLTDDWSPRPVMHLDLSNGHYDSASGLYNILNDELCKWEALYGHSVSEIDLGQRFAGVIERAAQSSGKQVVILIDEYDKPLLESIDNMPLQETLRGMLRPVYSCLKKMDSCIHFAMLTGVTKYGQLSIFSDLNNVKDVSMLDAFSTICGITLSEVKSYFAEPLAGLADKYGVDVDAMLTRLIQMYDGYKFSIAAEKVFNPYSLLNAFQDCDLQNYWFQSGTPTYLVKILRQTNYCLSELEGIQTTRSLLSSIEGSDGSPVPSIYQSGYLTIKDYDPISELLTLGYPNTEVKKGFLEFLLPYYANASTVSTPSVIHQYTQLLNKGDIDGFFTQLKSFFADIPYELTDKLTIERHYQNILYIIFKLLGFYTQVEYHTSAGRVDLVVKTAKFIYVIEFKLNGSAKAALKQINDKGYAVPFMSDERQILKVGVNFSKAHHTIQRWLVEPA